jgi:hypothetical protein
LSSSRHGIAHRQPEQRTHEALAQVPRNLEGGGIKQRVEVGRRFRRRPND